jgi:hypothetical protein
MNRGLTVYKTIILPVVLYRFETWSLTLREECNLRAFENRVLRAFGPKRDEVTGGWRKLRNEELRKCFSLSLSLALSLFLLPVIDREYCSAFSLRKSGLFRHTRSFR